MNAPAAEPTDVACLCAAWCRLCDDYGPVFDQVVARLRETHPWLRAHWIDIEDEADLVGELDIETFPTIVVVDAQQLRFAGPLTPQPETLLRVLRAALGDAAQSSFGARHGPEFAAFAERLRLRANMGQR